MAGHSAYSTDSYVNQRLKLKMDLPLRRETVLHFFDRVRKQFPHMDRLRRYANELALETSPNSDETQQWLAVRRSGIRTGVANPPDDDGGDGLALHRFVCEVAPFFLDINALDIEHLELLFGFDLHASGNHDAIVCRALMEGSRLAAIADRSGAMAVECQPVIGLTLEDAPDQQIYLEVKTRTTNKGRLNGRVGDSDRETPISVYLILRRVGMFHDVHELPRILASMTRQADDLIHEHVVPNVLLPLRDSITTG